MDSVVESLLNTLTILKKKRPEIHESCRDLLRLCSRCDIFSVVLVELKNHPVMLNDLTEAENELLYDLHTTIQNICTFIDDNVNRSDYKAITLLEFRLSYFTDLAQLNQKITQLIEALNLQEQIDLDRMRDEDLEDAKESFEYIVRTVIKEIARPTNVYFEEEFDSLSVDIDNHEEALSKLLSLLKHRPLSVAEAKVLKAEINKLKGLVEESRNEMNNRKRSFNPNDNYSNRRLPELPPASAATTPHTSATSKSSFASSSSMMSDNINSNMLISPFKSQPNFFRQSPQTVVTAIGNQNQSAAPFEENNALTVVSKTSHASSSTKIENYELNAQLLHRLLRNQDQLSEEENSFKRRLLESMALTQDDLEVTKTRVGRGTFGDVCLGTLRHRYKVAIKTLKRSSDQRKDEQRKRLIEKEMLIAKYLGSYPTIPVCYGFLTLDSCIQVVLELAPFGSLSLLLKDNQSFPIIPAALKIAWLNDLADAVRFLHSKEIMHKNICADNILVFEKLRLKLGDFGPEKSKGRSEGDIKAFLAPEVRQGKNPEYGSDIFSFAITAVQIFSRRIPHMEKPEEQVISAIDKEWIEPRESKEALVTLFLNSLKSDDNQHVNDVRPSSEDLFQEILTILETIGGDPREETHCNDYFVIQEIESVAKQRRNEMLRSKASYKSNLSLRPTSSSQMQALSSRRASINFSGSSLMLRSTFQPAQSGVNATGFSYSQFNKAPNDTQDFLSNSIDIEDKASIAYFLIQAAKFTPLDADFMADRLVRKGVSCVSTLRRKLHRDGDYLVSIGIDRDTAKRISEAIFSIKASNSSVGPAAVAYAGQSRGNNSSSSTAFTRKKNRAYGSVHSFNEAEGNTDRDNDESDSLESAGGSDPVTNVRSRMSFKGKKSFTKQTKSSARSVNQGSSCSEKEMMGDFDDMDQPTGFDDQDIALSPDESIIRIYQNSKQMMEKRNILSKFLRVEINLTPDLANKYSDIMIAHEIYDLPTLQKMMMNDSKILVNYGFDKRISNAIFDHLTVQAISKFQDDQRVNDVDMTLNPSNVSSSSTVPVKAAASNNMLKNYVADNCANDVAPGDVANLYYEASQMSNTDALERLLEVAESGDYLAQGYLMRMYVLGQGDVKQDIVVAQEMGRKLFPWLQHAIQTDNSSQIVMYARYLTGVCYSHGLGVTKDETEAIKWYLQSAHQGYVGAQAYLGYCYYLGIGVEKDLCEAYNWYRISALRGHSASQCNLGLCYEYGHGVERNLLEAIKWYRASAEQGDVIAQFSLGNLYEKGKKGTEQNFSEAFKYYKMSAEKGYDQAQYSLGCCYYAGLGVDQNLEQAFYWFALSASANNAAAQCKVGFCYENGIGAEKNMHKAIEFYRLASMQQHPAAMYYLGYCYFTGTGIEANVTEAVRLYMASASKKYAAAQNNLGFCYFNGVGVSKDLSKAIEWYTLAANQEYPAAQYNLGYCCEKGLGVPMDLRQSVLWYQKAAKNGHNRARKALKKLNEASP